MKYIITIIIAIIALTASAQPGSYFRTHTHYGSDTTFAENEYSSGSDYVHTMDITFTTDSTYYVIIKGYTYKDTTAYETDISDAQKEQNQTLLDAKSQEDVIEIYREVLDAKQNEPPQ